MEARGFSSPLLVALLGKTLLVLIVVTSAPVLRCTDLSCHGSGLPPDARWVQ
jgi:hypothetical protein